MTVGIEISVNSSAIDVADQKVRKFARNASKGVELDIRSNTSKLLAGINSINVATVGLTTEIKRMNTIQTQAATSAAEALKIQAKLLESQAAKEKSLSEEKVKAAAANKLKSEEAVKQYNSLGAAVARVEDKWYKSEQTLEAYRTKEGAWAAEQLGRNRKLASSYVNAEQRKVNAINEVLAARIKERAESEKVAKATKASDAAAAHRLSVAELKEQVFQYKEIRKAEQKLTDEINKNHNKKIKNIRAAREARIEALNTERDKLIELVALTKSSIVVPARGDRSRTKYIREQTIALKELRAEQERTRKGFGGMQSMFMDSSQGAAAFRAAMIAGGQSMGMFTAHTIVAAASAYALVSAIKGIVTTGAEYEKSMQRVFAISGALEGAQTKVIKTTTMLSKAVRDVAKGTVFTANEVAEAATVFAMAGFSASEVALSLDATASLASISLIEMGAAAETAAGILKSFDLGAENLTSVVDKMSVAVTNSMLTMQNLALALGYVGPLAKDTNTSFTDTVVLLELMHNSGIKASKAGTALRRGMVNLLNPSKKQSEVLMELGVSTTDAAGEMRSMTTIVKQLADKGVTPAMLSVLFGARAVSAWSAVIRQADGDMVKFKNQLQDSTNAAKSLREQLESNLIDSTLKFKSAVAELAIQLYDSLLPLLNTSVEALKDFAIYLGNNKTALNSLALAIPALMTGYAAYKFILIAIVPLLNSTAASTALVTLALNSSNKASIAAAWGIGLFRTALNLLVAHPVIAVLALASTALVYFMSSSDDATEATKKLTEAEELQIAVAKGLQAKNKAMAESYDLLAKSAKGAKLQMSSANLGYLSLALSTAKSNVEKYSKPLQKVTKFPTETVTEISQLPNMQTEKVRVDLLKQAKEEVARINKLYDYQLKVNMEIQGQWEGSAQQDQFKEKYPKGDLAKIKREAIARIEKYNGESDGIKAIRKNLGYSNKELKRQNSLNLINLSHLEALGKISPYEKGIREQKLLSSLISATTKNYAKQRAKLVEVVDANKKLIATGKEGELGTDLIANYEKAANSATIEIKAMDNAFKEGNKSLMDRAEALGLNIELLTKFVNIPTSGGGTREISYNPINSDNEVRAEREKARKLQLTPDQKLKEQGDFEVYKLADRLSYELELEAGNNEKRLELVRQFEKDKSAIELENWTQRMDARNSTMGDASKTLKSLSDFDSKNMMDSTSNTLGALQALQSNFDDGSKKAFEKKKKIGLAVIAVDTAIAVMDTYKAYGGGLWGAIPAAAMGAIGAAQYKQLSATTYQGGKAPAATSTPSIPSVSVPAASDAFFAQTSTSTSGSNTVDTASNQGQTNITFAVTANDAASFDNLMAQRENMIVGMVQNAYTANGRRGGPSE